MASDSFATPNVFRSSSRISRSPQLNNFSTAIPIQNNAVICSPPSSSTSPFLQVFPPRDSHSNCPNCSKFVADGFCCDICHFWFHPDCIQIPKSLIKRIGNISALKIECQSCRDLVLDTRDSSTQSVSTTVIDGSNQTESVSKLHRFSQTSVSPIPDPPSTLALSADCSTQTTELIPDPVACPVPILDLTEDTDISSAGAPAHPPHDFAIVQGEDNPLSNFYQFSFHYDNVDYTSVEQGYQHIRAVKAKKTKLADSILKSTSPREAKSLSKGLTRPDSRDADISLMRLLLRAKAEQCISFRTALANSGNTSLIHSTHPSDRFWGSGLFPRQTPDLSRKLPGENNFGSLLMELRPDIGSIQYSSKAAIDYVDHGAVVVMLLDGEKPTKSTRPPQAVNRQSPSGSPRMSLRTGHQHQTSAVRQGLGQPFCFHCGIRGHVARVCRLKHKEVKCYNCNTVGHKRRYCPFFYNNNFVANHQVNATRSPLLPTPFAPSLAPNGPNYGSQFPPLAPHPPSNPNFR